MKKILLLMSMAAFASMPTMAQEEDVTSYIANAGFDEDLTWNADGSKKGESVRTRELSDRSIAYVTEDGSLYATVNSRTPKTRPDGRTFEATNGFVGQIKGWDWASERANDGCEWVYFGTLPYDLGEQAIPIADDGTTYMIVPERPTDFDGGTGALYLRAGWGGSFSYKQDVKLPCAEYRLEYWTINVNPNTTGTATDLSKITCRRDVFQEEGGSALTATEWTKHEFEFTPVDKFTIEFGFKASNNGSGTTPWVFIDGIKLYKIGDADPADLLREDVYTYQDYLINQLPDSLIGVNGDLFWGILSQSEELTEEYLYEGDDIALLQESIAKLQGLWEQMLAAAEDAKRLEALYMKAINILDATDYPGASDLYAYCEEVYKLLYNSGVGAGDAESIAAALGSLQQAINNYYFSQEATMEEPANYSFLVQAPWFCVDGREPAGNTAQDILDATLVDADKTATGWVNGSTASATTGAWFNVGRTCYQLWAANNFTGYLDVHQELTGLPNGIYSVSCDMVTNLDALSDQHVYATSTLQQTEGFMTEAGVLYEWPNGAYTGSYPDDLSEPWETVVSEGTVIVMDGKLTIGARSTHGDPEIEDISNGGRRGCFWLTNFVLRYHGAATQEQINDAIAARAQKAIDLAAAMHFAADKKAVNDSIAAYNATKSLDVLNGGIALAEASEAKYAEIMEAGKTLPTVAENLADEALAVEAYGVCVDLVKYANNLVLTWLSSSTASYKDVDNQLNLMKAYVNTYSEAANIIADEADVLRSVAAQELLENAIASQKAKLMAGKFLTTEEVDALVADLNKLLFLAQAQDAYDRNPNATDYTGWIMNPDFAANDGWEFIVTKGDGPVKSGQYYNGDADYKYFDSYASGKGELNVTGMQVIQGIPNGTYQAKACVRTPNTGAFIFAAVGEAKADSIFVEIPLQYYTYQSAESGEDTTVVASDRFGPIWEEAMEAYQAGTATIDQEAIAFANGNEGRGWQWLTIDDIVVKDHILTIGQTCDPARTGKVFEGSWFSVTDWSLTLIEKGNNDGWNGPTTGVCDLQVVLPAANDGMYTLDGRRVSRASNGLYIVVRGGKASKVLVK